MRVARITLAGLLALMAVSVSGAPSVSDAAPVLSASECTSAGGLVSQAQDGHVDTCLRLGNLLPGPHTISLQDLVAYGPTPAKILPPGLKRRVKPTAPPSEPAVALSLSPTSGRPGTVVTVTGRLRRPFVAGAGHPNLCWDGCENGLGYDDVAMTWTSRRSFRARMIVPAAPWIEGGPARVVPLASGDYPVAIDCLREAHGCTAVTEGKATFRLRVSRPVDWCRTQATCGRLRVTPARALPGEVVRVTGFVPLASGNTPNAGSSYETVVLRRRPRQHEFRFTGAARFATAGLGAVEVKAPPSYAGLRPVAPLAQVSDGLAQIAADPANPSTVAWCTGQTITMSGPDGTTLVPSAAAKTALRELGFSFRFDPQPECAGVAPLATAAGAPAGLAAAFDVTTAAGAPPFYLAALVTHDDGRTWAPIPVPGSSGPAGFGGFRYAGAALEAVFARRAKGGSKNYPAFSPVSAVGEVTGADGQSWSQARLGCPPAGPCVTFGAYAPGNCAMNGSIQWVLRSTNGGRQWSALDFPYAVQSCGEAELIATSPTSELLVDSSSTYPVLGTSDAGATWHDIAIPRPPARGDVAVLPDGSLLVTHGVGYSGPWKLLRHGARAWCTVRTPAAAVQRRFQLTPVTVISDILWWLTGPAANPDTAPAANQVPLSALRC